MSILTLQQQLAELGRIRTGDSEEATAKSGRSYQRPMRLETFRLTSPNRDYIDQAAELWGGAVEPWEDGEGNPQWEVTTEARELPVFVPPVEEPITQFMELWFGGGCQRRCDGVTEQLQFRPCLCPKDVEERQRLAKDGQACSFRTRVRLVMPDLGGVGVWILTSGGFFAAAELKAQAEILALLRAQGRREFVAAKLRLERRPGREGDIFVPVLDLDLNMRDVVGAAAGLPAPARPIAPALPRATQRVPLPEVAPPAEGIRPAMPELDWSLLHGDSQLNRPNFLKLVREVAEGLRNEGEDIDLPDTYDAIAALPPLAAERVAMRIAGMPR